LLHKLQPDVCIALELGPNVPDAPVEITDQPTVWATDSYASMSPSDGQLVAQVGETLGLELQFQALSRGGSDASCSAGRGLCARPITLGLPMDNSHGYEIMHPGAMANLAALTVALLQEL
jgi:putative aminopeptidase FrvX